MTRITIKLETDTAQSFDTITKRKAINKSALVRQWIEEWVRANKPSGDVKTNG